MRTLAVIPARGGSSRLPGKNLKPFLGRPLIQWTIEFARTVNLFDRTFVSTDSDQIAECCQAIGHPVGYRRPAALATDTAHVVDVALDALQECERLSETFDLVALLQPTSPIRMTARWAEALKVIDESACDAVIGVSPSRSHPFHSFKYLADLSLEPWLGWHGLQMRSQDLPPAVSVCGALYLIRVSALREHRTLFPKATRGVLCDRPDESIDIDTEADWVTAEALARHYGR